MMKTQNTYVLPCHKKDIQAAVSDSRAHFDYLKHAVDFALPEGNKILAAQDGEVVKLRQHSDEGGLDDKYKAAPEYKNRIVIEHESGEYSEYGHLQHQGVKVEKGDRVKQGQVIGLSGNTGYSSRPHLHFHVLHEIDEEPGWETLAIRWKNAPNIEAEQKQDGRTVQHYSF